MSVSKKLSLREERGAGPLRGGGSGDKYPPLRKIVKQIRGVFEILEVWGALFWPEQNAFL